jgi:hypothetical protein
LHRFLSADFETKQGARILNMASETKGPKAIDRRLRLRIELEDGIDCKYLNLIRFDLI